MKEWLEAMRLRTLPVSVAGVIYAWAFGIATWHFRLAPALLCLLFAVMCQVASNFANEYFDWRDGLDKPGRVGPRRGVTEGDISPRAMLTATAALLAAACGLGCVIVAVWGEWWMYPVGVATAIGVVAYSAGPWPLSRHALGEAAVIVFFGIVPVCLTYVLMGGSWHAWLTWSAVGIGLMGANVLIVNNYRDIEDDRKVGKATLCTLLGRRPSLFIYVLNFVLALMLTLPGFMAVSRLWWIVPALYLAGSCALTAALARLRGAALTKVLGMTAVLMLVYAVGYLLTAAL